MSISTPSDSGDRFLVISPTDVGREALEGLVQEFVSRDGTDYGDVEWTLEQKACAVKSQLDSGEVRIVFDREQERVNLVVARDLETSLLSE